MERRYHSPGDLSGHARVAQDLRSLAAWCEARGDLKDVAAALAGAAAQPGARIGGVEDPVIDAAVFAVVDRCGDLLGLKDADVRIHVYIPPRLKVLQTSNTLHGVFAVFPHSCSLEDCVCTVMA